MIRCSETSLHCFLHMKISISGVYSHDRISMRERRGARAARSIWFNSDLPRWCRAEEEALKWDKVSLHFTTSPVGHQTSSIFQASPCSSAGPAILSIIVASSHHLDFSGKTMRFLFLLHVMIRTKSVLDTHKQFQLIIT